MDNEKKTGRSGVILIIIALILILAGAAALVWRYYWLEKKVSYQGIPWYQETTAPNHAALSDELGKLSPDVPAIEENTNSLADTWIYGNDMQVYAAGAGIAMDETYYYVADRTDGGLLYRVTKDGSYTKEKISDIPAGMISVQDGKLYFASSFANVSGKKGIYAMNTDGSGLQCISGANPAYLLLVNDWLYYLDSGDRHIYKMNLSDQKAIRLTDKTCSSLSIHENTIYFSCMEADNQEALASMDLNGENYRELASGGEYGNVMCADGKIYYVSGTEGSFSCMDPDGSNQRVIKEAVIGSCIQICDGTYYYIDAGHQNTLAVYRGEEDINYYGIENILDFLVFDQMIYVDYLEGTAEKVSMHKLEDGSVIPFFEKTE